MGPVRFGVVGCGCIGKEHIRNLLAAPEDVVELALCVDTDETSLAAVREMVPPSVELRSSVKEIREVDAVIVAVPNHLHAEVCEEILRTEPVHVLCEKPLATSVEDCCRIARLVTEDKVFAVGLEYRHIPTMRTLMDRLPLIGEVRMLSIREHRFPFLRKVNDWNRSNAKSGGTLVEKGCHFFDFMALCCRGRPLSVYARGSQLVNHLETADVLDHAVVVVEFEGCVCTLDLCMFAEASQHQLEVTAVGERGKLEAFAPAHGVRTDDHKPNFRTGIRCPLDWEGQREAPPESHTRGAVVEEKIPIDEALMAAGDHAGSTYYELLEFAEACRGKPHRLASAEDATLSVALGLAAHQSILTKAPVRIDDVSWRQ